MLRAINTQFRKKFNQKKINTFPKAYQIHSTIATIALKIRSITSTCCFWLKLLPPHLFLFIVTKCFWLTELTFSWKHCSSKQCYKGNLRKCIVKAMRTFYSNTIMTYRQKVIYRELSQHVLLKKPKQTTTKHLNISCFKVFLVLPISFPLQGCFYFLKDLPVSMSS